MEKFLVFHARYKDAQIGYFEQNNLVELYTLDSIKVSKCLLSTVEAIFQKFNITLNDLSFLAAHIGPSPYTTLRVVLATLNGINYAVGMPLVGVNGLDAFLKHLNNDKTTIILLNAFGNDLYYGISTPESISYALGCKNVDQLLNEIALTHSDDINFWGNGSILYKDKIEYLFGARASILSQNYDTEIVPIQFLAQDALAKWEHGKSCQELLPIYLK